MVSDSRNSGFGKTLGKLLTGGLLFFVGKGAMAEDYALNGRTNLSIGPVTNNAVVEVNRFPQFYFQASPNAEGGSVQPEVENVMEAWLDQAETNSLTATASNGWHFVNYTGANVSGDATNATYGFVIGDNNVATTNVEANFVRNEYDSVFIDDEAGINVTNKATHGTSSDTNVALYVNGEVPGKRYEARSVTATGVDVKVNENP